MSVKYRGSGKERPVTALTCSAALNRPPTVVAVYKPVLWSGPEANRLPERPPGDDETPRPGFAARAPRPYPRAIDECQHRVAAVDGLRLLINNKQSRTVWCLNLRTFPPSESQHAGGCIGRASHHHRGCGLGQPRFKCNKWRGGLLRDCLRLPLVGSTVASGFRRSGSSSPPPNATEYLGVGCRLPVCSQWMIPATAVAALPASLLCHGSVGRSIPATLAYSHFPDPNPTPTPPQRTSITSHSMGFGRPDRLPARSTLIHAIAPTKRSTRTRSPQSSPRCVCGGGNG